MAKKLSKKAQTTGWFWHHPVGSATASIQIPQRDRCPVRDPLTQSDPSKRYLPQILYSQSSSQRCLDSRQLPSQRSVSQIDTTPSEITFDYTP